MKSRRNTVFVVCATWSAIALCGGTASAGVTMLDQAVVNADQGASAASTVTAGGEADAAGGDFTDQSLAQKDSDGSIYTPPATDVASASGSDATAGILGLPEPSAWILALVGFVGLGLGAFRKRKPRLSSGLD